MLLKVFMRIWDIMEQLSPPSRSRSDTTFLTLSKKSKMQSAVVFLVYFIAKQSRHLDLSTRWNLNPHFTHGEWTSSVLFQKLAKVTNTSSMLSTSVPLSKLKVYDQRAKMENELHDTEMEMRKVALENLELQRIAAELKTKAVSKL
jgi:hypothetical protein